MSSTTSLYVDTGTWLHRLNPRAKFALAFALFVAAYVFNHPVAIGVTLLVALLTLVWTGGLRNLLQIWFIVVALFVVGFVVWPGFTPDFGPTVVNTPIITLSRYELLFALGRSMRIAAFIIIGLALVTVTSNEEIIQGLRGFGIPYSFCFAFGTALRLFPTFLGAAGTVKQAQEARGLDLQTRNPVEKLRRYVPLLIPVFMTAFRNVESQSMALEARGFDPQRDRTSYARQPFLALDWVAIAFAVVITIGAIMLSTMGVGILHA